MLTNLSQVQLLAVCIKQSCLAVIDASDRAIWDIHLQLKHDA